MEKNLKPSLTSRKKPHTVLPKRKKRVFALLCVALPLVATITAEGVLRWAGLGGHPPLFKKIDETPDGTLYISDIEKARSYFFANQDRPGYNDQYSFFQPKTTNAFRVLLAGGSAIKGYPQPRFLTPSAFLREMLIDAWPERNVEVLNIGTTAVASFPVMEMTIEGLAYDPDLVVIYSGHNEFFGAYGVASINRAGALPAMLKLHRWMRSTALVQGLDRLRPKSQSENKTLMEIMVGQRYTSPEHWSRKAAANNLYHNISRIIQACNARNIPVMVCTLPSNERDLAPLGDDRITITDNVRREELEAAARMGIANAESDPEVALEVLAGVLEEQPKHARAHYYTGKALDKLGRNKEALNHYIYARDYDPMPWRATSQSQEGVLRAARDNHAIICDVEAFFREASPGGSVGWELMDDHVHPSLEGEAMLARAMVERLTHAEGPIHVEPKIYQSLSDNDEYARRLGDNPFDRYGVNHQMRVLFSIPFMKETNPRALVRYDQRVRQFEKTLSPDLLEIAQNWQTKTPHAGGMRPITGMIARGLMRRGNYEEALRLLEIAQRSVPVYTSWHMEYVYFELACREKINGALTEEDRIRAGEEIGRGKLLLKNGYSESGMAERYVGRLHQLRGEFAEAIPFLLASRLRLTGFDLVAIDQALFLSYVNVGAFEEARKLAEFGFKNSGQYSDYYRQLLTQLPSPAKTP